MLLLALLQDRHAGEFGAIVGNAHRGVTVPCNDQIELAWYTVPGQRNVGNRRQALAGEVIDHGQDPEPAPVGKAVRNEIQRPALVWPLRQCDGGSRTDCTLASTAFPDYQPFFTIEPEQPLMVDREAVSPKQEVKTAIAEPRAISRQCF